MTNHAENLAFGASQEIVDRAKNLRKRMTLAERVLWDKLRDHQLGGFKFRRQHPIDWFIADFYCHEKRLVVELDGGIHSTPEQREYDEARTGELENWEIEVIRFTNDEVLHSMDRVLLKIKEACERR